jgi:two-component system, chemotaxis family, response regulator Rcp1
MTGTARTAGRILLVEDSHDDAVLIREAFREANEAHELRVASDGEEALTLLRGEEPLPDLVLLDLNLPKLDGHGLLAHLKADPRLRRIPVVVLTSSIGHADIVAAYDAHANAYLRKPVGFAELAELAETVDAFWFGAAVRPPR